MKARLYRYLADKFLAASFRLRAAALDLDERNAPDMEFTS